MIVTRKITVDAMTVAPRVLVLSIVTLTSHTSFSKLFHHLDKLLAVVLEQIVGYC